MLEALKFVQGAVARKGLTPELTHFRIENGRIRGFNGSLSLSSPIDIDLAISPKAAPFIKAISSCRAKTKMDITKAGKLAVRSGRFKAFVECSDEPFPDVQPEGEYIDIKVPILACLKSLAPFMAEDASRPWARGIRLKDQSACATNNIIIVESWLKSKFPIEVNIPASAIKEIIRIGKEPKGLQISDNSLSLHWEDGRWLRTNTSDLDWPDLSPILSRECKPVKVSEMPEFFEALEDLKPFVDELGKIHFLKNYITTDKTGEGGAFMEMNFILPEGAYNIEQLMSLRPIATAIDFGLYPQPCLFFGDNIRGAIVGMKG